ncbi:MAG: hypothetical protein WBE13_08000 [Candidatus Acidiferrum sp.]
MMFDMVLGCFRRVMRCVLVVAMSEICVMGRRLVLACFMVLRGFPVMASRMFVVLCGFLVVLYRFV